MKDRWKKFVDRHEDAVFFISTCIAGISAGALCGMYIARRNDVVNVQSHTEEGTVCVHVALRNGQQTAWAFDVSQYLK